VLLVYGIIAHHNGIKMLGVLALVGVFSTLTATTVVLPVVLDLLEGKRSAGLAALPRSGTRGRSTLA